MKTWYQKQPNLFKKCVYNLAGLNTLGMPFAYGNEANRKVKLRFGIVTDIHYADTAVRGLHHYRESMDKLAECIAFMNDKKVDFLVELGDFKDEDKPAFEGSTLSYLEDIEKVFGQFNENRYHVLGNHDLDSISKEQFLAR